MSAAASAPAGPDAEVLLRERETFRYERMRAVAAGVLETANATFLLLIAERLYHAGPLAKSILQTNSSIGLLLTPLVVSWMALRRWSAGKGVAVLYIAAAIAVAISATVQWMPLYIGGMVLAFICAAAAVPLFAAVYEANYRVEVRGQLFSKNVVVRILAGLAFSWGMGKLLEHSMDHWRWVLAGFALALGVSAWCIARCPQVVIASGEGTHPLRALRHVAQDRPFRLALVSWMLMGFANLVMFPLRVEYLAAPEPRGLHLSAEEIALFTSVIPNAARLLFTRVWGRLFDRVSFYTLRTVLNMGFMLGILSFFTGGGQAGLWAGAILFGISNAGADVVWSLWVTKFAPPERVTEYMSVHTFFTGIRGVIAPFAAFYCAAHLGVAWTALGAALLIIAATVVLLWERPKGA